MIHQLVAIRDSAANVYMQPWIVQNIQMAVRLFSQEVNKVDPHNTMYTHPECYELFHIGTYDNDTSRIVCHDPKSIALGTSLKLKQE